MSLELATPPTLLDFTDRSQREHQWVDQRDTVWAWRDPTESPGGYCGWHYWDYSKNGHGGWVWCGLSIHLHGPFDAVSPDQEYDDYDGGWVIHV
ncbi:hypothetical protein ACWDTP_12270 [Mycobacterium sp. NPDC003449]